MYLLQLLDKLSPCIFHGLIHSSFTIPSPQTGFPTAVFSCLCIAASRASETMFNTSSHRTRSPCCSIAFLLIVGIELIANQCQSVCVCVPCAVRQILRFCAKRVGRPKVSLPNTKRPDTGHRVMFHSPFHGHRNGRMVRAVPPCMESALGMALKPSLMDLKSRS